MQGVVDTLAAFQQLHACKEVAIGIGLNWALKGSDFYPRKPLLLKVTYLLMQPFQFQRACLASYHSSYVHDFVFRLINSSC